MNMRNLSSHSGNGRRHEKRPFLPPDVPDFIEDAENSRSQMTIRRSDAVLFLVISMLGFAGTGFLVAALLFN